MPCSRAGKQALADSGFVRALAASFGRGVHLRMPHAVLRRALGEMAELLLEGQNAIPAAALAAGSRYRHPVLDEALAALAASPRPDAGQPDPAAL